MSPFADLAAIVLAAGFSRRMGGENKLLKDFQGAPLITHALATLAGLDLDRVIVVVGPAAHDIVRLLTPDTQVAATDRNADGMGASLAAGAAALPAGVAGAFVVLADMPLTRRSDYEALAAAFAAHGGQAICVPVHEGQRGHPVLFPARAFSALAACQGDTGARHILADPARLVVEVAGCSPGILADFDDPASFARHATPPRAKSSQ